MNLPFALPSIATWQIRLAIVLVGLGGSFAAGWAVNGWRLGKVAATAENRRSQHDLAAARSQVAETALIASTGQKIASVVLGRLEHDSSDRSEREKAIVQIVKVPVYGKCPVTGDGVRVINSAVDAANAYTAGTGPARPSAP